MDSSQEWSLTGQLFIVDPPIHYPIPFSCNRLPYLFVPEEFLKNKPTDNIPDSMDLQECIDQILEKYFNAPTTWALDAYYKPTTRSIDIQHKHY